MRTIKVNSKKLQAQLRDIFPDYNPEVQIEDDNLKQISFSLAGSNQVIIIKADYFGNGIHLLIPEPPQLIKSWVVEFGEKDGITTEKKFSTENEAITFKERLDSARGDFSGPLFDTVTISEKETEE